MDCMSQPKSHCGGHPHKSRRCTIIVSGFEFTVSEDSLRRYPNTLLGDPERRNRFFDHDRQAYFFDRHRLAFEGILAFYQSFGRTFCPENVPTEVFEAELEYFDIQCDFRRSTQEAKKYVLAQKVDITQNVNLRPQVWRILHNPDSSRGAQAISAVSLLLTVVSIALACLETVDNNNETRIHRNAFPIECACFAWFTLEYAIRLWASPERSAFLRSWIDATDLITLAVFYSSLALTATNASPTSVLRIFRLANAFRVFRLTRFSNGLRLLIYTIYKSRTDLELLAGFMVFFIVISGSSVYFAEADHPDSLFQEGIFDGLYYSVVTCTTVGYGDIVPITPLGKLLGALTATFGAIFLLLPVLKLVAAFSDALSVMRSQLSSGQETLQMKGVNVIRQ